MRIVGTARGKPEVTPTTGVFCLKQCVSAPLIQKQNLVRISAEEPSQCTAVFLSILSFRITSALHISLLNSRTAVSDLLRGVWSVHATSYHFRSFSNRGPQRQFQLVFRWEIGRCNQGSRLHGRMLSPVFGILTLSNMVSVMRNRTIYSDEIWSMRS
jgi:hypothetical protein